MKKFFWVFLCFLVICCTSSAMAEIDLSLMSFEELSELQTNLEEEMRTRNVKMLDLKSLGVNELEELMLQALHELCLRQEFVDNLGSMMSKSFQSMFGGGVQLMFRNEKGTWFNVELSDENIELILKTKLEQVAENLASIPITIDQEAYDEAQRQIEETRKKFGK